MQSMYYIGLDVHKQKISYCVKDSSGKIYAEGWIPSTRFDLDRWMKTLPQPWSAALEATMFSGWIYEVAFSLLRIRKTCQASSAWTSIPRQRVSFDSSC
jgi:hypothetical protein